MTWKKYDTQYRLRKELNPASPSGEVDYELWLLYVTPGSTHNSSLKHNIGKCLNFIFKGSYDKKLYLYMYNPSWCLCGSLKSMHHCTKTTLLLLPVPSNFSLNQSITAQSRITNNTTNGYPYNPRQTIRIQFNRPRFNPYKCFLLLNNVSCRNQNHSTLFTGI